MVQSTLWGHMSNRLNITTTHCSVPPNEMEQEKSPLPGSYKSRRIDPFHGGVTHTRVR